MPTSWTISIIFFENILLFFRSNEPDPSPIFKRTKPSSSKKSAKTKKLFQLDDDSSSDDDNVDEPRTKRPRSAAKNPIVDSDTESQDDTESQEDDTKESQNSSHMEVEPSLGDLINLGLGSKGEFVYHPSIFF